MLMEAVRYLDNTGRFELKAVLLKFVKNFLSIVKVGKRSALASHLTMFALNFEACNAVVGSPRRRCLCIQDGGGGQWQSCKVSNNRRASYRRAFE